MALSIRHPWSDHVAAVAHRQCGGLRSLTGDLRARRVGAGPDKPIVLVLDGAGWHRSAKLSVPEGIHLVFLPPYSPELQPSERLWPLTNEPLANRSFATLDELEQVQAERCRWLQAQPTLIRAHTCFHWWPTLLYST